MNTTCNDCHNPAWECTCQEKVENKAKPQGHTSWWPLNVHASLFYRTRALTGQSTATSMLQNPGQVNNQNGVEKLTQELEAEIGKAAQTLATWTAAVNQLKKDIVKAYFDKTLQ